MAIDQRIAMARKMFRARNDLLFIYSRTRAEECLVTTSASELIDRSPITVFLNLLTHQYREQNSSSRQSTPVPYPCTGQT